MLAHTASLFAFDFYNPLPIRVEVSDAPLTSDAGLLPLRQFDHRIGLTRQFAAALNDPRDPDLIDHTFPEMVRSRVFGILAGYADQNDHDTLRTDPVFKLVADRSPTDADLASQPTLSRFENAIDIPSLFRLRDVHIDQFIASFAEPPLTLTFDLDAVDDPTHGSQQLTLFHGFYEQYQYLPLVITCAENDAIVRLGLRHGTATASLGADDDLEYLVTRIRSVWPDVRIRVRGDGGFGNPTMYEVSESLDVIYTFGLSANAVLQRETEALLAEAVRRWDETHEPQRLFAGFWYRAGTWNRPRWVVAKCEANGQGTNRRFVTTNRAGAQTSLEATYDEYAMRGEREPQQGVHVRDGDGSAERPPVPGQLLPAGPARGGVEPAGAAASGDCRPTTRPGRRCPRGRVAGASPEAVPERATPARPAGRRPPGDLATLAHQGGGVGRGELPPHRDPAERQLAPPARLRAGGAARLSASSRGTLLGRDKALDNSTHARNRVGVRGWCVPNEQMGTPEARRTLIPPKHVCPIPLPE